MKRFLSAVALVLIAVGSASASTYGKRASGGGGGISSVTTDGQTIDGTGTQASPLAGAAATFSGPNPHAGTLTVGNLERVTYGFDMNGYATRESQLAASTFGVTNCTKIDLKSAPSGPLTTLNNGFLNDAAVPGGGASQWNQSRAFEIGSVYQAPKTAPWAVFYHAILLAGSSYAGLGWTNQANSHDVVLGVISGGANYRLAIDGTSVADTGVPVDGSFHSFMIGSDDTDVHAIVDDTDRITAATSTLTTVSALIYGYSSSVGAVLVDAAYYCN